MEINPEINRIDVVLLGNFNPAIFSPAWFAAQGLIGEQESEEAKVEIIHSDVAIFGLPWCRAQITRDRFSVFTEQEAYFGILYDLIVNTFKILEHTPIHTFGNNWGMHFKCESEKEWHNFGHFLVPQEPWKGIFEDSAMLKLEMVEKQPPKDPLSGRIQIHIEPSRRIKHGIFFNINHHFETSEKEAINGCHLIMSKFESIWEKSRENAKNIVTQSFDNFKIGLEKCNP
jgi:hypothetical protein